MATQKAHRRRWRTRLFRLSLSSAVLITIAVFVLRSAAFSEWAASTLAPAADAKKGGYVLSEAANGIPDVVLIASGSEVSMALEAQAILSDTGRSARVVSMPCWELFDAQDSAYRASVLPVGVPRVSIEAGITHGWERYVGIDGEKVGIDRFGASAPGNVVADQLGLNIAAIQAAVDRLLGD